MIVIIIVGGFAFLLVVVGVLVELNTHSQLIAEPDFQDEFAPPSRLKFFRERFYNAVQTHPNKPIAIIETILWIALLIPLAMHILEPRQGLVAWIFWALTIVPHEMGHVLCLPFGRFLTIAGGSIWQILFWLLLALYQWYVYRQVVQSLMLLMVVGHSFINLSIYIGDAQERSLPLLFGAGQDHHDWGNLLDWAGLLAYDDVIAGIAVLIGTLIVFAVIILGILSTWMFSRR